MKIIKREKWVAVVNDNDYELDEKQAAVLNQAISENNRGIIQFDGFIISIPFLQEFYRVKVWDEEVYSEAELKERRRLYLAAEIERDKEWEKRKIEWEKQKQAIEKAREKLMEAVKPMESKEMSRFEFEKRRKELLEQAKTL